MAEKRFKRFGSAKALRAIYKQRKTSKTFEFKNQQNFWNYYKFVTVVKQVNNILERNVKCIFPRAYLESFLSVLSILRSVLMFLFL